MPDTASPTSESLTTRTWGKYPEKFSTICLALIASAVAAELVEVNRFLRTVFEGKFFWYYLSAFLMVLGFLLSITNVTKQSGAESHRERLIRLLLVGMVFGFVGSLVALSATPLLTDGRLSPAINAWKDPTRIAFVAFLSFGWFYGALAELTIFFIRRGQYQRIGILILTCIAIRFVEMLPWVRLFQR